MSKIKKNGPLTEEEKNFIKLNMINLSPANIAEQLNRNAETVAKYISQIDTSDKNDILNLKKREDWPMIKGQFSEDEIAVFEWHWENITKQFKQEIFHTEGMQLINAIKHEILGNRNLTDQQKLNLQIAKICKELDDEYAQPTRDMVRINDLERLVASLTAAVEVNAKEYRESCKKLEEALKGLKAQREQRLARVEDSRKSFYIWLSRLLSDKDMQKELGEWAEKRRMASEIELQRLGAMHQYEDGDLDRPILNLDTLKIESDISKFNKSKGEDNDKEN